MQKELSLNEVCEDILLVLEGAPGWWHPNEFICLFWMQRPSNFILALHKLLAAGLIQVKRYDGRILFAPKDVAAKMEMEWWRCGS